MKKPKPRTKKSKRPKDAWTTTPVEGTSGKGPLPPDISDLQRRIKANPLGVAAEAKHKLHQVQAGYRRELYAVLAMILGIGRHYYYDHRAWKAFFAQPFFHGGKHKPKARTQQKHALRHTMIYVFDAKSKQARNRTGKYAAALHEYMIVGVPVDLVAEHIEKDGGIEQLYEAYLEREALTPKKGRNRRRSEEDYVATMQYCHVNDDEEHTREDMTLGDLDAAIESSEDPDGLVQDGREDGTEDVDRLQSYGDVDFMLERDVKRGFDPDGRPTLEFEMSQGRKERFFQMPKGRKALVYVTCLGTGEENWQRFRVRKVNWRSSPK